VGKLLWEKLYDNFGCCWEKPLREMVTWKTAVSIGNSTVVKLPDIAVLIEV